MLHALVDDVPEARPVGVAVERERELILAVHHIGYQRHVRVVLHVLEQQARAVADEVTVGDSAEFAFQVDLCGDALEHAVIFQQLQIAAQIVVGDTLAGGHNRSSSDV